MKDNKDGSGQDPQHQRSISVLDKAIDAVTSAFKNGSAETAIAHWPEPGYEINEAPDGSELRDGRGDKQERRQTVTYTFEPAVKKDKDSKPKKNKKKRKKEKKKLEKAEKKLDKKLKKKEKKAKKKQVKEIQPAVSPDAGHPFNEAGPYGPGGL